MERNKTLDFFRGFAALWIILIHTCFHSGNPYVPAIVKSFSLIIDVPLFIFLAGYSLHYSEGFQKNVKRLVRMYIYYLVFLLFFFLFAILTKSDGYNLTSVVKALFFEINDKLPLRSFDYSIWFIPMYFIVTSVGSYFLKDKNVKITHLILLLALYGSCLYFYNNKNIAMILMYLFLYVLGYYSFYNNLSLKKFIAMFVFIIILNILFKYLGTYGFRNLQTAKFDYDIYYLIYSMIVITLVWYLLPRFAYPFRFIPFLGRNAILLYFCQGFSSSILYYIAPRVHLYWMWKLLLLFGINIIICLSLFFIFYKIFDILKRPLNKVLDC